MQKYHQIILAKPRGFLYLVSNGMRDRSPNDERQEERRAYRPHLLE